MGIPEGRQGRVWGLQLSTRRGGTGPKSGGVAAARHPWGSVMCEVCGWVTGGGWDEQDAHPVDGKKG